MRKFVFMVRHVYTTPAKADAFGFQAKPLLECGVSAQFDLSSEAEDSMPGQSERSAKGGSNLTRSSWQTCGASHSSVGGNFAAWDLAYGR
jgi:hypothetical protein